MRKKWNIILSVVLLMFTSVFLSACTPSGEAKEPDTSVSEEQTDSTEDVVSDKPIEYDKDYVEDDEPTDDDFSDEVVEDYEDEYEDEIVNDEADDIEATQEEESEY